MSANNIPVVPVAGAAVARAVLSLLAFVTHWLKAVARARRHRREAAALARLDHRMLADIGLSRSDVDFAFSQPFWQDPTELLDARVSERRLNSGASRRRPAPNAEPALRQPPVYSRPRYTI